MPTNSCLTIRRQILALLIEDDLNAREISQAVGVTEKEVPAHLGHIARTVAAGGRRLVVRPFQCLACGFVFNKRQRYTRPGRCPACRQTHLASPTFRII